MAKAKTLHRPHRSSQYDAFRSQARDQCFTRLANMRRNTVTYWTTADFANRETCSFIGLNDAFWKTLLQAAKKKSRKLTDHGKQFLSTARDNLKCNSVLCHGENYGKCEVGERVEGDGERCEQHFKHMFFCLPQLVRFSLY